MWNDQIPTPRKDPRTKSIHSRQKLYSILRLEATDGWALLAEELLLRCMSWPDWLLHDWELDMVLGVLLDVLVDNLVSWDLGDLDDRDLLLLNVVGTGHLLVHSEDSTLGGSVSEFLVDVVSSSDRAEGKPNTIVLDTGWFWFDDLLDSEDFAVSTLKASDAAGNTPELGLGANFIGSENLNTDSWWVWNGLSWDWTGNDLVVLQHNKRPTKTVITVVETV